MRVSFRRVSQNIYNTYLCDQEMSRQTLPGHLPKEQFGPREEVVEIPLMTSIVVRGSATSGIRHRQEWKTFANVVVERNDYA